MTDYVAVAQFEILVDIRAENLEEAKKVAESAARVQNASQDNYSRMWNCTPKILSIQTEKEYYED